MAAAAVYGAFVYLMLPAEVTTLGDDFGYYKSIVETIQHGRPWTDSWLEPWAASLSILSALAFKLTGSFHAATYGLQAVLGAAEVGLGVLLLRNRGHTLLGAIVLSMLFFTFPTMLWKFLEFTGIVLYWPCLLGALLAAEKRKWGWFFLVWALAVASRQSALAWLIIPGWEIGSALVTNGPRRENWERPALVVVAGLIFFALLAAGMNKSHAQSVITDHVFEQISPRQVLVSASIGLVAFALAAGGGAFLLRLEGKLRPFKASQISLSLGFIIVGAAILRGYDVRQLIKFEHASFAGLTGGCFIVGLLAAAIVSWVGRGFCLRGNMMVYALGSLALVCLRADLWDYYLGDILIFGLLGVSVSPGVSTKRRANRAGSILFRTSAGLMVVGCAVFNLRAGLQLKLRIDQAHATNSLIEHAFRAGQVTPDQFYGASFGYIAWHLQPYFIAHEGRHDPKIAHFWNYLLYSIDIRTKYLGWLGTMAPFRDEFPEDPARLITSEIHPIWWFFTARFTLQRATLLANPPTHVPLRLEEYRRMPYPLNDAEWREFIATEHL